MPRDYLERLTTWSVVVFGNNKTGKSRFALTSDQPIAYFETDFGSFDRAISSFTKEYGEPQIAEYCEANNPHWLLEHPVPTPGYDIHLYRCPFLSPDDFSGTEFYYYVLAVQESIRNAIKSPDITSVVIDTGTQFWQMQHFAEFVHITTRSNRPRERMSQIEYGPANARMQQIFREAASYGKNLLIICKERPDQFENNDGTIRRQSPIAGWSQYEDFASVTCHFGKKQIGKRPYIEEIPQIGIYQSGAGLGKVNYIEDWPTWEKLVWKLEE